jgi:hypothetical protein
VSRPAVAFAATFAALTIVYGLTNYPWVASGDSGEFQVLAATGGIAHAGYPTFVLALEAFGKLPWSTFAFRANLLCALCGAFACAVAAWHGARMSGRWWAGAAAGIALGLSYQLWQSSTVAEIYGFTLALAAALFHLSWRLARNPTTAGALGIGLVGGLGIGSHLTILALAPVALVALAVSARVRPIRGALVAALLSGFLVGLAPLAYFVAQDRPDAPMNYLALKQLPGEAGPAPSLARRAEHVVYLLSGRQYLGSKKAARGPRGTAVRFRYVLLDFGLNDFFVLGPLLAVWGAWLLLRRRDLDALLFGTWLAFALFLIWYGAVSYDMAATYFLSPCWILAAGMALALARVARRSAVLGAALLPTDPDDPTPFVRLALPPPFAAGWARIAWDRMPAEWNPLVADRSWDEFDRGVLERLPPRALVLANWTELMTLKYARYATGLRPDIDYVLTEIPWDENPAALRRALGRPLFTTLPFAPKRNCPASRCAKPGSGGVADCGDRSADRGGLRGTRGLGPRGSVAEPGAPADHVARALFDLARDRADVAAEDPEQQELHGARDQRDQDLRRPPLDACVQHQPDIQDVQRVEQEQREERETQQVPEVERASEKLNSDSAANASIFRNGWAATAGSAPCTYSRSTDGNGSLASRKRTGSVSSLYSRTSSATLRSIPRKSAIPGRIGMPVTLRNRL